jgi:hypothetical protein
MGEIKTRRAALISIVDTDANLYALNKVYLRGQRVLVIDSSGRMGEKVGEWDWKTQPESAGTKYRDLPWFIDPTQAGSSKINSFAVRITDTTANPKYEFIGGNTIITDNRLIGKTDYLVASTQLGGAEFRDDVLTYDGINGKVTIAGFELSAGEKVRIVIPQGISADPDYQALENRVDAIEKQARWLFAPFTNGAIILPFGKPRNQIHAGWEPYLGNGTNLIEGRKLKALDTSVTAYDTVGKIGGADSVKLGVDQIPEMDPANGAFNRLLEHNGLGTAANVDSLDGPSFNQPNLLDSKEIKKVGTPVADQASVSLEDKYYIVDFITPILGYVPI